MSLVIGGILAYLFLPLEWAVVVILGLVGVELFEIWIWLRWRKRRSLTGPESMIGERGVLASDRRVRIRGTTYPARVIDGTEGDRVVIEDVEGMTFVVRRA